MIDLAIFIIKYTFIGFIYLFLFWLLRLIAKDLRTGQTVPARVRRAMLVLEKSPGITRPRKISLKEQTTIGRGGHNTLVLNDESVSTAHARIYVENDGFILEDLGSTNGTFIDGHIVVGPISLKSGAVIKIGRSRLVFTEK